LTPSVGEELWRGTRPAVAGLDEWLDEVCAEARAAPGERGRVLEHCLQVLHSWDYDLRSLRSHWRRVCQLRPLPALGPARWSRDDTFALEQIQHWYPGMHVRHVSVGAAALTSHTRAEVAERIFWLIGERSVSRPLLNLAREQAAVAASPPPPFQANLVGLSPAEKKRKMSATLPLIFSRIQEHNRSL
jgi:hypothetical protein